MEQQRSGDPTLRRWNDLNAEEKLEIDRALFKGVRVGPEYADLAADKAAAMVALFAPRRGGPRLSQDSLWLALSSSPRAAYPRGGTALGCWFSPSCSMLSVCATAGD